MQQRYVMIEGVPGVLVTDPEGANVRRYAGMQRDPALDGEPEAIKRFRPRREVRVLSHDLTSAIATKTLVQHGPIVVADSHEDAEKFINAALNASTATSTATSTSARRAQKDA